MTSEAFQDEAVILEVRNWQTADKYAVCFCRHHGKYLSSPTGQLSQDVRAVGLSSLLPSCA